MSNHFSDLPHVPITLVRQNGQRVAAQAIVGNNSFTVFDKKFPVATGDTIEHELENGNVELYVVVNPGANPGNPPHIPAFYEIKVRSKLASVQTPSQVVHHNYNNSGQVAAMGPNAQAIGNSMTEQHVHQTWNAGDAVRIADELAALRKELLVLAAEDPDDAIEVGAVAKAEKALKAGDEKGFFGALKGFGKKTWQLAERLGLEYMKAQAGNYLGLPPGGDAGG